LLIQFTLIAGRNCVGQPIKSFKTGIEAGGRCAKFRSQIRSQYGQRQECIRLGGTQ